MAKIAIIFNFGSEYRQFVSSGFIGLLRSAGHSVEVMSRHEASEFHVYPDIFDGWIKLPEFRLDRFTAFIASAAEKLHIKKLQKTGLMGWDYGRLRSPSFKERLVSDAQEVIAAIAMHSKLLDKVLGRLNRKLLEVRGKNSFRILLKKNRPDLVIVTVPRLLWQSVFLDQTKILGIRTVCLYHTNKDAIAAPVLDHAFDRIGVWNAWMKASLLKNNPWLTPEDIRICGCGHFDCFAAERGLPAAGNEIGSSSGGVVTVLYTAADPALFKSEFRYVRLVSEYLKQAYPGNAATLVVRLNPMDDTGILETMVETQLRNAVVSKPAWHFNRKKNICVQQPEDVAVFSGLLNGSRVCVGLASTLAIDCAVAGLPFINIGFELPGEVGQGKSAKALWDADFYKNVRASGAAVLVESPEALKSKLLECIENRKALDAQQEQLMAIELGGIPPGESKNAYFEAISDLLIENQPIRPKRNPS